MPIKQAKGQIVTLDISEGMPEKEVLQNLQEKYPGKIITKCYFSFTVWKTKKDAIDFFKDCARHSEGCERDRYTNIMFALEDGEKVAYHTIY